MKSKILSIVVLSLLAACAGSPPKQERPIKVYSGSPSRQAMCRRTKAAVAKYVESIAQHSMTRQYAAQAVGKALAVDGEECIKADAKEFGALLGLTADDMRVLLQYQENLLYSCEKWKQ